MQLVERSLAACICTLWISGCNAILGINAPSDHLLDSGARNVTFDASYSGDPITDAGVASTSTGDAEVEALSIPHAWAAWPMPNPVDTTLPGALPSAPNPEAYVEKAGIVSDQVTALQWQQTVDAQLYTWTDATKSCASLTLGGNHDWRLPTRIELVSLIDYTSINPLIDAKAFPNTPTEHFWSASPFARDATSAWGVSFGFSVGLVFKDDRRQMYRVRCVRLPTDAADSAPHGDFVVDVGTVTDSATKLTWQRQPPKTKYTWPDAQKYCASLKLQSKTWRLPTVKELHTLIDETQAMPAIDRAAFPDTVADYHWTASQVANFPTTVWTVSFAFGFDGPFVAGTLQYLRCVR